MTTVRFATVCDKCGKRSTEYEAWASCDGCQDDVCPECSAEYREDEGRKYATCHNCAAEHICRK